MSKHGSSSVQWMPGAGEAARPGSAESDRAAASGEAARPSAAPGLLPAGHGFRSRPLILHAIHSGGFYGAEKVVLDLLGKQKEERDFEAAFLAFLDPGECDNEVTRRVRSLGVRVIYFTVPRFADLAALKSYGALMKRHRVSLVHSHGYKVTFFHALSRILGFHRTPFLVTAHGYAKGSGNLRSHLYRITDLALFRLARAVVAVSGEMQTFIAKRARPARLERIDNGIDTAITLAHTHPLKEYLQGLKRMETAGGAGSASAAGPATEGDFIIGAVGRLVPMKNHLLLVQAFARLLERLGSGPERGIRPRLVIIGEGPLREPLLAEIARLRLEDRVHLLPFKKDILEWVEDFDLFCLSSTDGEGLPMALLEAGLLGKGVVCTRSGGIPELIEQGVNGLLAPLDDLEALTAALERACRNPDRMQEMGRRLRDKVHASHSVERAHEQYAALYREALRRGAPAGKAPAPRSGRPAHPSSGLTARRPSARPPGRLKILQVTPDLKVGGLQRVVIDLAQGLIDKGHEVHVCSLRGKGPLLAELERRRIPVHPLPWPERGADRLLFLKVRDLIRRENYDVVHTHNTQAMLDAGLPAILLGARARLHTDHARVFPDKLKYMLAEKALSFGYDRIVAVSDDTAKNLRHYEGIAEKKLTVITNGIDGAFYRSMRGKDETAERGREWGLTGSAPVLGVGARLEEVKGVRYAVEALPLLLKFHPQTLLAIAGTGSQEAALRRLARDLGVEDRVRFLGALPDLSAFYPHLDILLVPSLSEGTPLSLLEAMALEIPMVASAVGGIPKILSHRDEALLVPPANPDLLASAVLDLLNSPSGLDAAVEPAAADPGAPRDAGIPGRAVLSPLARTLAQKAKAKFDRLYDLDRMVTAYQGLYLEALARTPKR